MSRRFSSSPSTLARSALALVVAGSLGLATGCGSAAPSGPVGGPVADASDQHCVANGVVTSQHVGACLADTPGATADAGAPDGGGDAEPVAPPYGATLSNSSGYDDDCKYQVSFTSTPVRKNEDVTFTVTVAELDTMKPATGAQVYAEVYLTTTVVAPNSDTTTTETSPGVYKVGPIVFNRSGLWTVRFHMYEMCSDAPADSPHGHAAFYIDVP